MTRGNQFRGFRFDLISFVCLRWSSFSLGGRLGVTLCDSSWALMAPESSVTRLERLDPSHSFC